MSLLAQKSKTDKKCNDMKELDTRCTRSLKVSKSETKGTAYA